MPLNTLLQERGHETIGAGNALAVQNFIENAAMLFFAGGYSLVASLGVAIKTTAIGFGLILLACMSALAIFRMKRVPRQPQSPQSKA